MKSLKTLLATALVGAGTLAFVGCKSDEQEHMHHSMSMDGAKPYPLTKCIVSDDAFDHGKPVVFVYQDQEIKLCCQDCRKEFDKDPAKYLTKLTAQK